jgi:hypothetical protein
MPPRDVFKGVFLPGGKKLLLYDAFLKGKTFILFIFTPCSVLRGETIQE